MRKEPLTGNFHLCLFKRLKGAQRSGPEDLAVGREADDPRRAREQTRAKTLFDPADQLADRRRVEGQSSGCSGEASCLDDT
jgi:hypothetical protein